MFNNLPLFVKDKNGLTHYLTGIIGQGGQGMVCSTKSEDIVVKLLCKNGAPIKDEKLSSIYSDNIEKSMVVFIPDSVNVCAAGSLLEPPYCGYVMKLMDSSKLSPLSMIRENGIHTISLKKRLEILIELSRTLAVLHSNGIVYCDLSLNNVFTSLGYEAYSKVWLIDSDNIRYSSDVDSAIYTPGYGAPELLANYTTNTVYSDIYSFAVIAFELLIGIPPMVLDTTDDSSSGGWDDTEAGSADTLPLGSYLYVGDKQFPGFKEARVRMEERLTSKLIKYFDETFDKATINDFRNRIKMHEWYSALINMYSLITKDDEEYVLTKKLYKGKGYDMFLVQDGFSSAYVSEYIKMNEDDVDFTLFDVGDLEAKETLISVLKKKSFTLIANSLLYDGKVIYSFECEEPCITNVPKAFFVSQKNADGSLKLINKGGIKLGSEQYGFKTADVTVPSGKTIPLYVEYDDNKKDLCRRFILRVK